MSVGNHEESILASGVIRGWSWNTSGFQFIGRVSLPNKVGIYFYLVIFPPLAKIGFKLALNEIWNPINFNFYICVLVTGKELTIWRLCKGGGWNPGGSGCLNRRSSFWRKRFAFSDLISQKDIVDCHEALLRGSSCYFELELEMS